MKKMICAVLALMMLCGIMTGCGSSAGSGADSTLHIVATIFPEYDWVCQILGDQVENVELTLLLDNSVDLHNYQPTTDDLITISTCDLFIYVGGNSDSWVEDALQHSTNKNMVVIDLFDILGDSVKEEAYVEGMEHDHDEEHAGDEHDEEHTDAHEDDEHIWLSLKNAKEIVSYLAEQLGAIDSSHADIYMENASAYIAQLDELDSAYQATVDAAARNTLLFADRFPFRYLVDDYGIEYYAAFSGCSAESEASFETIAFLSSKVDELGLTHVLTTENATHKIAQTVVENTSGKDQTILALNSLQSVTARDVQDGMTYLDMMTSNLDVLREALS